MPLRLVAAALLACSLSGCVVEPAGQQAEESARQRFLTLARAATFGCEVKEVLFFAGRDRLDGQPFRIELVCTKGSRETFTLNRPVPGRPAGARFFDVVAHDETARREVPQLERLLQEAFLKDPWLVRGGTFDTRNAVGRGSEIIILLVIVATFIAGFFYVLRARPESSV